MTFKELFRKQRKLFAAAPSFGKSEILLSHTKKAPYNLVSIVLKSCLPSFFHRPAEMNDQHIHTHTGEEKRGGEMCFVVVEGGGREKLWWLLLFCVSVRLRWGDVFGPLRCLLYFSSFPGEKKKQEQDLLIAQRRVLNVIYASSKTHKKRCGRRL